VTNPTLLSPL